MRATCPLPRFDAASRRSAEPYRPPPSSSLFRTAGRSWSRSLPTGRRGGGRSSRSNSPKRAVPAARPPLPLMTRMPSKRPWPPPVRV